MWLNSSALNARRVSVFTYPSESSWVSQCSAFSSESERTMSTPSHEPTARSPKGSARTSGAPYEAEHVTDPQSGLLRGWDTVAEAGPVGSVPVKMRFSDYREAGSLRVPFRTEVKTPAFDSVVSVKEMETNIEVDPAIFEPPAGG